MENLTAFNKVVILKQKMAGAYDTVLGPVYRDLYFIREARNPLRILNSFSSSDLAIQWCKINEFEIVTEIEEGYLNEYRD